MPLKYFILLIIALCNIAWAFFIWLRNPRDKINIFFGAVVLGLSIWSALVAILYGLITSPSISIVLGQAAFIVPLFAVMNFFIFTYYYPYQKKLLSNTAVAQLCLSFTVIVLLVSSNFFLTEPVRVGDEWVYTYNRLIYGIFSLVLLFYLGFGFYNLFTSTLSGEKGLPYRARVVIVGVGVVAVFGVIFSLVSPYVSSLDMIRFLWLGPTSSLFMIIYISYFIFIKK